MAPLASAALFQPVKPLEFMDSFRGHSGRQLYARAKDAGMGVSALLNRVIEKEKGNTDQLDGFERVMRAMEIRQKPVHEYGIRASTVGEFFDARDGAGKTLFPEWAQRQMRRVSMRALYTSQDRPLGTLENAYTDNMTPQWDTSLVANIGVAELIAMTIPVVGRNYRSMYLTNNAAEQHMSRVSEGASIPRWKLTSTNVLVGLHKYGGAIEVTYEQLREMTLDMLSFHLQRVAIQAEVDKVAKVIDILINGDGNPNTAAEVINFSTLDPDATPGTDPLSLRAWVNLKLRFENPFTLTTALGTNDVISDLYMIPAGESNIPLMSLNPGNGALGGIIPINNQLRDAVAVGNTADVGADKLLVFDKRLAIHRLYQVDADVSEVATFIENQTQLLTVTETEGYEVGDRNATKIVDLAN